MISSLELVNSLPNGKMQTVNSMKYHSRILQGTYNIMFKYHYLHHTYGTNLTAANTPEYLLCDQMGYGNSNVTHKYYVAISEKGIDELLKNVIVYSENKSINEREENKMEELYSIMRIL